MAWSWSRRRWLRSVLALTPAAMVADATWFEPQHPIVRTFPLAGSRLGKRLVHITDLHFKGDVAYLRRIVAQINELKPEAILFTGDFYADVRFNCRPEITVFEV